MKKVAIFMADGFEEIEGLTVVDILRRAGISIDMVSIKDTYEVTGSHNITVKTDKLLVNVQQDDSYDMLVMPGGMPGTRNLEASEGLMNMLDRYYQDGHNIAAICAAPTVFGHRGYLKGRKGVCYPGMEDQLTGAQVLYDPAITDGNVTTGRGMGTAIDFALEILDVLGEGKTSDEIAKAIVYK